MRTAFTTILVALLGLLLRPTPAAAHAFLLSTTPDNWQLLDDSPTAVSMRFSEPVDLGLAKLRLVSPRGNDIAGIARPEHPAGHPDTIAIRIPETLPNGTYTVAWRVISADTHPVQGAFTFSVREATAPAAVAMAADPGGSNGLAYGVARWLTFAGFALFVGTAFMIAVGWPGTVRRRGARRMLGTGLVTMLAGTLAALLLYGPYAGGLPLPATLGSRVGRILEVRLVLLGVAAALLIRFLRRDRAEADLSTKDRTRRGAVVLAGAVALAVTWSLVTHSAGSGMAALSVPVDVVHLVTAGVWVGGLPVLLGVLLRSGDVLAMRTAIPRFSTVAGVCVAVLVTTGLYQSWREVGTVSALVHTTYGGWLLAKLALLAVLLSIGAFARRWVRRQYGFEIITATDKRRAKRGPEAVALSRFRRLVATEVIIAGLLLGGGQRRAGPVAQPAAGDRAGRSGLPGHPVRRGRAERQGATGARLRARHGRPQ